MWHCHGHGVAERAAEAIVVVVHIVHIVVVAVARVHHQTATATRHDQATHSTTGRMCGRRRRETQRHGRVERGDVAAAAAIARDTIATASVAAHGLFLFAPLETSRLGVEVPLLDLLLEARDHVDGLLENAQLGLRLVRLEMDAAHLAELLEGLVDVAHAQAFARVVGRAALFLARLALLGRLRLVDGRVLERRRRRR